MSAASLAITVVAASVGGFVALRRAFDGEGRQPAITPTIAPGPDTSASLDGEWTLTTYVDLNGLSVEPAAGTSLSFSSGSYGIDARCSLVGGRFEAKGSTITFSEFTRSDSGCSTAALAKEEVLIQAVTTAATFEIEADTLTLFHAVDEAAATLTRGPPLPGHDIGLPFRICSSEQLGFFLGEGRGSVWVGTRVRGDRCPDAFAERTIAAADVDGDGAADVWTQITCRGGCDPWPVGAVDVNADGQDEIFVSLNVSSTPQYQILTFVKSSEPSGEDALVVATVGALGHPQAGFQPGHVAVFMTGGDEGFAGRLQCQDWPDDTVLSSVWTMSQVDSTAATKELHRTRFTMGSDGTLSLVEALDETIPAGQPVPAFTSPSRCGDLDLDPFS